MKRAALVVGVNHYRDERLCPLQGAHDDAADMRSFLRDRAGFEPTRLLVGGDANQGRILEETKKLMEGLSEGDLFVFFFAGHGVEPRGKHWLLCPEADYDEESEDVVEAIPVSLLKRRTEKAGVRRLFILDACRGKLRRDRGGEAEGYHTAGLRRDLVQRDETVAGRGPLTVLCSCDEGEVARELPGRNQGLFSAALLEELNEAVREGREVRVGTELAEAVGRRMARVAVEHGLGGGQTPWPAGPAVVLVEGTKTEGPRPSSRVSQTAPTHAAQHHEGGAQRDQPTSQKTPTEKPPRAAFTVKGIVATRFGPLAEFFGPPLAFTTGVPIRKEQGSS